MTGPLDHLYTYGLYTFTRDINTMFLDLVFGWAALASLWPVYRRFGLAYSMLIAINLLPPLILGGWLSIGRLVSTLFPFFLWLAAIVPARHLYAWVACFAVLQAFGAVLFYTWRPFL